MTQILYSYISEKNHEFLLKELLPGFSTDFQNKLLKYRRWQDAQLSLLGRTLLGKGLENIDLPFCENNVIYTSYNKPYFKEGKVKFNISHSGNMVVCAITETCEIGIDIEMLHSLHIEDFKTQMTALEWQRIISSDNPESSFFDYWTQKEAVIKALGIGLSLPLDSFEIIDNKTIIDKESFFLKEILLDNKYKCHIAFKDEVDSRVLNLQMVNPIPMFKQY
ncbi:4'-phosphopantetheinyl transferase superfamily protein [Aquimarina sp. MMG015]|uniref:4'-phosphopantetheinyl transferase family protein n=1 Tax=Aquimarina sp. MMG015 TaxID=2822689 RepID=UPI001B3A50C7|nr:4'-phosphopantetheinyl transferase superfamily protein [Aquimarina sp. MMG015]MBQ4803358.1 4'-phosphopantetheinyl transferase superfamily protein [Aquimarina sp. MMG015]